MQEVGRVSEVEIVDSGLGVSPGPLHRATTTVGIWAYLKVTCPGYLRSVDQPIHTVYRFRAKRDQLEKFEGLSLESQGQNLALTVLYASYSLDSGVEMVDNYFAEM